MYNTRAEISQCESMDEYGVMDSYTREALRIVDEHAKYGFNSCSLSGWPWAHMIHYKYSFAKKFVDNMKDMGYNVELHDYEGESIDNWPERFYIKVQW